MRLVERRGNTSALRKAWYLIGGASEVGNLDMDKSAGDKVSVHAVVATRKNTQWVVRVLVELVFVERRNILEEHSGGGGLIGGLERTRIDGNVVKVEIFLMFQRETGECIGIEASRAEVGGGAEGSTGLEFEKHLLGVRSDWGGRGSWGERKGDEATRLRQILLSCLGSRGQASSGSLRCHVSGKMERIVGAGQEAGRILYSEKNNERDLGGGGRVFCSLAE